MATGHHFGIFEDIHCESLGDYVDLEEALAEIERLRERRGMRLPIKAPCKNWKTCGRRYEVFEYDPSKPPPNLVCPVLTLKISAKGVKWDVHCLFREND
jgi:hypothetical protein